MKAARELSIVVYTLLSIGLIFIYNSSSVHSQNVFGDPRKFFFLHTGWLVIGFIVFIISSRINMGSILVFSKYLYIITICLLSFLAIWGLLPCNSSILFAPCINSANRWLVLNPPPLPQLPFIGELSFQPSELAKLVLIFFLSTKLKSKTAFKAFLVYTLPISALIILQPNMSTAVLTFMIGVFMYVASGESLKPFYFLVPTFLILGFIFILSSPYRLERLTTFMKGDKHTSETAEGYQITQVKIALGSGGLFGVGFGQSRQKYTYLPEVATDSIFAVIGEEFGFLGSFSICALFFLFIYKSLQIARNTDNIQDKLIASGLTAWLGMQFFIHMAANSGIIPYTGVPLPFISYGGSSLLFSMAAAGFLLNISRKNKYN